MGGTVMRVDLFLFKTVSNRIIAVINQTIKK